MMSRWGRQTWGPPTKGSSSINPGKNQIHLRTAGTVLKESSSESILAILGHIFSGQAHLGMNPVFLNTTQPLEGRWGNRNPRHTSSWWQDFSMEVFTEAPSYVRHELSPCKAGVGRWAEEARRSEPPDSGPCPLVSVNPAHINTKGGV